MSVPAATSVPEAAIEIIQLTRRFAEMVALNTITLSVPRGSIFGLRGPNGAGKSTLIKMLTTLLPPSSGTALVAGFDIVRQPKQVRRLRFPNGPGTNSGDPGRNRGEALSKDRNLRWTVTHDEYAIFCDRLLCHHIRLSVFDIGLRPLE
jgi:ABC-type oligopeptide transport system ATPase subunit